MKINNIISYISVLFILSFSNVACNSSDDDSGTTFDSSFRYEHDGEEQPLKDFYAYLNVDSQLIISAFSPKIPVEGIEDQVEDIYIKKNLVIALAKFEEGRYSFEDLEAVMAIDSLFYAYNSEPYKTSTLFPEKDSLDNVNSFVYIKDINLKHDVISGNFRLHRMTVDTNDLPVILYEIEGDFQHIPYTEYK